MRTAIIIVVIVILLGIFGPTTLFTVDETKLVVVTQFGKVKQVYTEPGLKAKIPFVQKANKFDKRLLRIDTPPATLNDVEKQFLVIDAYTRYRITDVRKFFEKLRTLRGAEDRIGSIVTSNLKEEVAQRTRQEIIGGSIEETPEGETVVIATSTRQDILDRVLLAANKEVGPEGEDFGVAIVEVRIKRADFPDATLQTIFTRMRAERERISRETRAQGAEEDAKIRAVVDRDRAIILALAERTSSLTRGEGDAKAIEIFASALEQDPEFFAFQRSLQAYKKFLPTNTTVLLSSEAELFQFLQDTEFIPVQKPVGRVGTIESLSGNLWIVGAGEVRVTGSTRINLASPPSVGDSVFVGGVVQQDGTLEASQVLEGIRGLLEGTVVTQLLVDDQVVDVTGGTKMEIDPQQLLTVYVEGERTGDRVIASMVTEGVRGSLRAITDTIWTVGTTDITKSSITQIEEGAEQVGADVLVSVARRADESLLALKLVRADSTVSPESLVGVVNGVTEEWTVGGSDQVITIDEGSNIELGADQVGLVVLIGFHRQDDGPLLGREARIELGHRE